MRSNCFSLAAFTTKTRLAPALKTLPWLPTTRPLKRPGMCFWTVSSMSITMPSSRAFILVRNWRQATSSPRSMSWAELFSAITFPRPTSRLRMRTCLSSRIGTYSRVFGSSWAVGTPYCQR